MFNAISGETHVLSPLPAAVLEELALRPQSVASLASALAARCDPRPDAGWEIQVSGLLMSLEEIDLVERCPG